jgi:hypothetical protein
MHGFEKSILSNPDEPGKVKEIETSSEYMRRDIQKHAFFSERSAAKKP